jgi:ganglioside GM2 activator
VKALLKENLTSPIKLNVTLKKKVFLFYVTVPCEDGFGSCTYNNVCSLISQEKCPKLFVDQNISCRCPIAARNYTISPTELELQLPSNVPKSLASVSCLLLFKIDLLVDGIYCYWLLL